MATSPFPLPVSLFSTDLMRVCSGALEDAWAQLGQQDGALPTDLARLSLAQGIVLAVTLGVRDGPRLTKAALAHLERETSRALPSLQAVNGEASAKWQEAERYRYRAEELRTAIEEVRTPECREVLTSVAADYERMAASAERIAASRAAINGNPVQPRRS